MTFVKKIAMLLILFVFTLEVFGQEELLNSISTNYNTGFKSSTLLVPSLFIAYGFVAKNNLSLKKVDLGIKEELNENFTREFIIDDFTQYSPTFAVYALNFSGVKGQHSLGETTLFLTTSTLLMVTSVRWLKSHTQVVRPDGSASSSFPSGHTATAFMGAEILRQEYKDVSVWYGIAGYTVAAGTGFFRMYNDRHWLTDVIAGAGIGMLSTKVAYWINPFFTKTLFCKGKHKKPQVFYPYFNGDQFGLCCSLDLD